MSSRVRLGSDTYAHDHLMELHTDTDSDGERHRQRQTETQTETARQRERQREIQREPGTPRHTQTLLLVESGPNHYY